MLKARLESGAWAADAAPATEHRLCEEFGASRTTVRQALSHLKEAGLLESRAGVGTRRARSVLAKKVVRASGDPLHATVPTKPRVTAAGTVASPAPVAEFFGIRAGAPIWHFVRVYSLQGEPLSIVDSYLPAPLGAAFTRADLQRQPMHQLLWERHQLRLHRSVHTVRVGRADVDVAAQLQVALADPVLHVQSCVYLADGAPIRWTENWFREDRYEYVAEMEWPDPPTLMLAPRGRPND
ncbi:MAG TPA: GntR family transcriptional regulator [Burkholderiaceae bacterium]|nr:GntR family transcriptional regulator [Burkholderiaceae bacterium]